MKKWLLSAALFLTSFIIGCVPTERTVYTPDRMSSSSHHHDEDYRGDSHHENRSGHNLEGERSITVVYDPREAKTQHLDRTFKKLAQRYDGYQVKFIDARADYPDRNIRAKMRETPAILFYGSDGKYSHTMEGSQITDSYAILKVVQDYLEK